MITSAIYKSCLLSVGVLAGLLATAQRPVPAAYGVNAKVNYVRVWVATAPEKDPGLLMGRPLRDVKEMTEYVDGLGRKFQAVAKQASLNTYNPSNNPSFVPTAADMVDPIEFDQFGRPTFVYMPFAANAAGGNVSIQDGKFKVNPFQQQAEFYRSDNPLSPIAGQGETYFYGKTVLEASPLNRVTATFSPGNNWMGNEGSTFTDCVTWTENGTTMGQCDVMNHSVRTSFWVNTWIDEVHQWDVTEPTSGGFATFSSPGVYPEGTLFKIATLNEQNKQVIEFRDYNNNIVLRKVQLTADRDPGRGSGHLGWLCTYYIRDELGNLRGILQPEGVQAIQPNWIISPQVQEEQCFLYEYDEDNLVVMKKSPGKGPDYMVYDSWERLVLSQSATQRLTNSYTLIKYDALNRQILTAAYTDATPIATIRTQAKSNVTYRFEELASGGNGSGYTSRCWPTSGFEILAVEYFDSYAWLAALGMGTSLATRYTGDDYKFLPASDAVFPYAAPLTQTAYLKGLSTGSKVRVLGTSTFLYNVTYYDENKRVLQTFEYNYPKGATITTNQYSFSNQLLMSDQYFYDPTPPSLLMHHVIKKIEYDDLGRMQRIHRNTTPMGTTYKVVADYEYDAIGKLKRKKLAPAYNDGAGLETQVYDYNIRGWQLGMNRGYARDATSTNYFGYDLGYDKASNELIGNQSYATPQYNGNIEGMVWKSKGDGEKRKYDFTYDAANRLIGADFNQYTGGSFNKSANVDFSVSNLTYDYNGNIKTMNRKGLKISTSPMVDQLTYAYYPGSNRLKAVVDAVNDPLTTLGDFRTLASHPQSSVKNLATINSITDYDYDANGNLSLDNNKGITSITYNLLNLPAVITLGSKTITYTYDAMGEKVQKVVAEPGQPARTVAYVNGEVFENGVLQFAGMDEGRLRYRAGDNSYQFDYFIKDHLGNTRLVLTEEAQQSIYPAATLEGDLNNTATASGYEKSFYSIDPARLRNKTDVAGLTDYPNHNGIPNPYPAGNSGATTTTSNSAKLYSLKSGEAKTGLGITLRVMSGDKIDIHAKSFYNQSNGGGSAANSAVPVLDILSGLLGGPTGGVAATAHGGVSAGQLNGLPGTTGLINQLLSDQTTTNDLTPTVPKAFINYLFFDEQFNCVKKGFSKVGSAGTVKNDHFADLQALEAPENGYVYIYCSNESPVEVFFDNLQVVHTRGPILEETHYYPYGLTMAGISSQALNFGAPRNTQKYNDGSEWMTDHGVDLYETTFRGYDPQLGRFTQADPLAEEFENWSPYVFGYDNPISWVDPEGLEGKHYGDWDEVIQAIFKQIEAGDLKEGTYYRTSSGVIEFSEGVFSFNKGSQTLVFQPSPVWIGETQVDEQGNETVATLVVFPRMRINIPDEYMPYEESGWDWMPVIGSGLKMWDNFKKGRVWTGLFHAALAVSDVFLLKSIATAGIKGAWKVGSHTWGATRKWALKRGYAVKWQPLHHWALTQKFIKKKGWQAFANQPWNLKALPMSLKKKGFSWNEIHNFIEGKASPISFGPGGMFNPLMRAWYGTPDWFKAGVTEAALRPFDQ